MSSNLFSHLQKAQETASTSDSKMYGVEVAIVTNVKDPNKLGQVKVCFPRLPGKPESDWVRVVQPAAGAGRGFYWIPEVNDEVLVAFEFGDIRRPFVVGSLYNGGALRINGVTVPKTGTYQVNIRYTTGDPRSATVSANGLNAVTLAFPPSGGWGTPATLTVALQLQAGTNTIEIDSSTPVYSPDIDKVEVALTVR